MRNTQTKQNLNKKIIHTKTRHIKHTHNKNIKIKKNDKEQKKTTHTTTNFFRHLLKSVGSDFGSWRSTTTTHTSNKKQQNKDTSNTQTSF